MSTPSGARKYLEAKALRRLENRNGAVLGGLFGGRSAQQRYLDTSKI